MQITSLYTGQEFLIIDKSSFKNIIRKLERKFSKNNEKMNIDGEEYIVYNNEAKKIKDIIITSKKMFDIFKNKLEKNILIQNISNNITGKREFTADKLIGHNIKYSIIKKNLLLLEITRHPFGDDTFIRQYWLFNNNSNHLDLIYNGERTKTCKSIGEIQIEKDGKVGEPEIKKIFNENLIKYYGEEGKKFFWEKIHCYDDNVLPQINEELKIILKTYGVIKLPQEEIGNINIPYINKLMKAGIINGDSFMKTGKKSIESLGIL